MLFMLALAPTMFYIHLILFVANMSLEAQLSMFFNFGQLIDKKTAADMNYRKTVEPRSGGIM